MTADQLAGGTSTATQTPAQPKFQREHDAELVVDALKRDTGIDVRGQADATATTEES